MSLRSLKALCARLFCSALLLLLKERPLFPGSGEPLAFAPGDNALFDGERSLSAVSREVAGDAERSTFIVAIVKGPGKLGRGISGC